MNKLLLVAVLLTPVAAHADGWIHCSGPDSSCNASNARGEGAGLGLLMIAGVTYMLGKKRRR